MVFAFGLFEFIHVFAVFGVWRLRNLRDGEGVLALLDH